MAETVASLLIKTLHKAGVKRIYGIVGDSLNGVVNEVRRQKTIEWVHVRHEEAAAFAAGADAAMTGELAVCAGSSGPGNLHLINGLFDCHRNMVPVLAIASHIPSGEIGTGYFQETHPERIYADCSYFSEMMTTPEQMPRMVQIAMQTAVARRGVAVVGLPGDLALKTVPEKSLGHGLLQPSATACPAISDLERLADMIAAAKNVTLFCGAGCAGAHDQVVALCERLKAPSVHALRGKEWVEYDNPYDVGMTGLVGFASGYRAMMKADLVILLGTDFPYSNFYPAKAKIAQIDIRPERLGRRTHVDLGISGDVHQALDWLLTHVPERTDRGHLDRSLKHYAKARADLDKHVKGTAGQTPIHPEYLTAKVSEAANDDAIFTADVGEPTLWAARYLKMTEGRRLIGSFNHGSMANAMPQAIGAQVACPDRQVISLSGDGGFTMLMGEILTLRQLSLPVKVVIYNNGLLGFVDLEMKASGFTPFGTDLDNPDFAKMAEAIGMFGIRIEDPTDVEEGIAKAFAHDGPAIVDVVTNPNELAMPPKLDLRQALSFSAYAGRAIIDGRGKEIIELVDSNLR